MPSASLCVEVFPRRTPESRSEAGALLGTWCSSISSVSAQRGVSQHPQGAQHSPTHPTGDASPSQAGATLPSLLPLALGTDCPVLCTEDGEERGK